MANSLGSVPAWQARPFDTQCNSHAVHGPWLPIYRQTTTTPASSCCLWPFVAGVTVGPLVSRHRNWQKAIFLIWRHGALNCCNFGFDENLFGKRHRNLMKSGDLRRNGPAPACQLGSRLAKQLLQPKELLALNWTRLGDQLGVMATLKHFVLSLLVCLDFSSFASRFLMVKLESNIFFYGVFPEDRLAADLLTKASTFRTIKGHLRSTILLLNTVLGVVVSVQWICGRLYMSLCWMLDLNSAAPGESILHEQQMPSHFNKKSVRGEHFKAFCWRTPAAQLRSKKTKPSILQWFHCTANSFEKIREKTSCSQCSGTLPSHLFFRICLQKQLQLSCNKNAYKS